MSGTPDKAWLGRENSNPSISSELLERQFTDLIRLDHPRTLLEWPPWSITVLTRSQTAALRQLRYKVYVSETRRIDPREWDENTTDEKSIHLGLWDSSGKLAGGFRVTPPWLRWELELSTGYKVNPAYRCKSAEVNRLFVIPEFRRARLGLFLFAGKAEFLRQMGAAHAVGASPETTFPIWERLGVEAVSGQIPYEKFHGLLHRIHAFDIATKAQKSIEIAKMRFLGQETPEAVELQTKTVPKDFLICPQ